MEVYYAIKVSMMAFNGCEPWLLREKERLGASNKSEHIEECRKSDQAR